MAKVVFDKTEVAMWLHGENVPNGWAHHEFRKNVADALNILAGHMGGWGIDLVDEKGNDLSDPNDDEKTFSYGRVLKKT